MEAIKNELGNLKYKIDLLSDIQKIREALNLLDLSIHNKPPDADPAYPPRAAGPANTAPGPGPATAPVAATTAPAPGPANTEAAPGQANLPPSTSQANPPPPTTLNLLTLLQRLTGNQ